MVGDNERINALKCRRAMSLILAKRYELGTSWHFFSQEITQYENIYIPSHWELLWKE